MKERKEGTKVKRKKRSKGEARSGKGKQRK